MFKVFGFLTEKDGLGMQDFIEYYDGKHVPLARRDDNRGEVLLLIVGQP